MRSITRPPSSASFKTRINSERAVAAGKDFRTVSIEAGTLGNAVADGVFEGKLDQNGLRSRGRRSLAPLVWRLGISVVDAVNDDCVWLFVVGF